MASQPIVINKWNEGIADSPHAGLGLIRNGDIEAFPGALKVGRKPASIFHAALSVAFTAVAATDVCTLGSGSVERTGLAVTFSTTGTLPAGLSTGTIYWLRRESATTFKVATSLAIAGVGTVVDITDTGTGVHTVTTVDPGQINHIDKDYIRSSSAYQYFLQDSNARVWWHLPTAFGGTYGGGTFLLSGNTLTDGIGNGLTLFTASNGADRYLFAFRDYKVDVVNVRYLPIYTWSNAWQSSLDFMTTDFASAVTNCLQVGGRVNPVGSEEPVVVASSQSSSSAGSTSLTFNITVPEGYSNLAVVVIAGIAGTDANGDVTGVTFDGNTMTELQSGVADSRFSIQRYVAPGTGSKSIVVTYTGSITKRWAQAFIVSNAHQTTPFTVSSIASGGAVTTLKQAITLTATKQLPLTLTFSNGSAAHTPRLLQVPIVASNSLFTAASVFSSSFFSLATNSNIQHYAIKAQDDIVYFCNSRLIGSIQETVGSVFDPSTAATYTFSYNALDLPSNEYAEWIEELGSKLMIAGGNTNKIYPWDRTSTSFDIPLEVPEVGIKRLKNNGGLMYILAGTKGNIYQTQGTFVDHVKKIPDYVTNNAGTLQATIVTWGGIALRTGALLFGAGVLTSGNSGVYCLYPDGRLIIDSVPSTGSSNVTALLASDEFYYMGYSGGADLVSAARYSSFETVVHSDFFRVSTKTEKSTLSTMEVVIAQPASTGNIRVSYRVDTSSAFTTIDTFVADGVSTTFKNDTIGLTDLENIQVQVEMDGGMELLELRFIP